MLARRLRRRRKKGIRNMISVVYIFVVVAVVLFIFRSEIFRIKDTKIDESLDGISLIKIVKVFSTVDEGILRSMLESAGIETKSDSTNFQRIQYGNLTSCLYGITISVRQEDVDEAKEIINDFIINKKKSVYNNKEKMKRTISTLFFEPALHREIPELLI